MFHPALNREPRSHDPSRPLDRRGFVRGLSRAAVLFLVDPILWVSATTGNRTVCGAEPAGSAGVHPEPTGRAAHPEPRPDVDGSLVLDAEDVAHHVRELFDGIRSIPHIADGIGCHCGCGAMPGMRSLLSCYEDVGMAQFCVICEGEGRLAVRLHGEGASLEEIRVAIDRRFG